MNEQTGLAALRKDRLQRRLLFFAYSNLAVVALLGVLLRAFPFVSHFPLSYKNLLHGHSHFAFGGWLMPVLLHLIMKNFPALKEKIPYHHWRNMVVLILLSAYGMLIAFPLQGYKSISISFSTLSIVATVYLTVVVLKTAKRSETSASLQFLKWGLLYGCFSSLGPFSLGPLMVLGKSGSPLYFDAIYFYLHFQYNGFFTFVILALLYRTIEKRSFAEKGRKAFFLFNSAVLPAYALSLLWHLPPGVFHLIGGAAAVVQLAGLLCLLSDVRVSSIVPNSPLLRLALAAFVLKIVLQLLSAFPAVAYLAYQQRNFVIAYLHLVLLGFISLAVFGMTLTRNRWSTTGTALFLFSFVTTEMLLVLNASSGWLHFAMPYHLQLLFLCSITFPVGIVFLLFSLKRSHSSRPEKTSEKLMVSETVA